MEEIIQLIDEYRSLALDKVIDYEKYNEYAIVQHSCTIEGSTLTDVDTRLLLDEGITPAGKPLEHSLMTKDHYEALQFALNEYPAQIDEAFIQQINAKAQKTTGKLYHTPLGRVDASKGEYRKGNVTAGGSYFPNYEKVPALMQNFTLKLHENLKKANTAEEQLNTSFDAHFSLVSIHPFYDGNGRTSRLLMNAIQHHFNLPLAVVFKEDRALYFNALIETRENNNSRVFLKFMQSQYRKYLTAEILKYKVNS
jgi:Fic family protein